MKEILKIHKCIPQFEKALEEYLRSNYREAEIKKGRRENTLILKRSAKERLTIRFESDTLQKTTILYFHYYKWVIRGIHYGMSGVWPTPIAMTGSDGFEESLSEKLGRYLGMRYWVKVELLKSKGIKPDTFFCIGPILLGGLFFVFCRCFDFANTDSIWWLSGWYKRNGLIAVSYSLVIWILFFYMWNRRKRLPLLSYVILIVSCMIGWLSLSTAYNVGRLDGSYSLIALLYLAALLVPIVMGGILYRQSQRQKMPAMISKPLFNP